MTLSTPWLPTWLLRNFGCSTDIEAVIGDIAERYNQNPSRMWYWRQVLFTIAALALKDVQDHKLMMLRGLMLGWLIILLGYGPLFLSIKKFYVDPHLGRIVAGTLQEYDQQFFSIMIGALPFMIGGNLLLGMLSGWLIVKLHRPSGKATALLFASSVALIGISFFPHFYQSRIAPWLKTCAGNAVCRLIPLEIEWGTVLIWFAIIISILYGGIFITSKVRTYEKP